jgi:hypothetical protein
MVRIFVALILASSLAAAPPSVEKLLKKPRLGDVALELRNGEKSEGALARVTDRFLALREPGGCKLIPVPDIREVRFKQARPDDPADIALVVAMAVIASPVVVPMLPAQLIMLAVTHVYDGEWESSDGKTLSISQTGSRRQKFNIARGRFILSDQVLQVGQESFRVEFDCDAVILTSPDLSVRLNLRQPPSRASGPVVGSWLERARNAEANWSFRSDGTYRLSRSIAPVVWGNRKGPSIAWQDGTESHLRRFGKTLFVTTNGVTEKYRKSRPD